ncbi:TonB-dependent receptor [Filimonas effusa]|uniref:TonB-dependent receptor n=1 Tax=Filimonas effusa TaxID=2508721 RepID=A0A4Q1D7S0_9BACT|nr:TonB-dependent receptor [Filimonas effusa]RXK85347.1 TonB-dependent receptor [Filimonas effusa]
MKYLSGMILALFTTLLGFAQTPLEGIITDSRNQPVEGVTITLSQNGRKWTSASTNTGNFSFSAAAGSYELTLEATGKKMIRQHIVLPVPGLQRFRMEDQAFLLEPLEVRSIRASDRAPFTKTNIGKEQIARVNLGQDLPFLLNQTPSVIVASDAGNGIGYTSMRIRGSDVTRINVTLNGIPYNDAESQGSFFVDLPDLASSANSIQIQRGVGTSTNGAGAFGATVNITTNEFNEKAYAESNNNFGSFNTWKNTLKAGSGLINGHFTVDARLSRLKSDGYIDRASSDLKALYLSSAYLSDNTTVRFNIITGTEKTYQAWYGVPEAYRDTYRTYNAAGTEKEGEPYNNQTDNYQQDHYQLFLNQNLGRSWTLNVASFLSRGKGYYEEYKAKQALPNYGLPGFNVGNQVLDTTDLVRDRWLDNYYYGQTFSVQSRNASNEFTIGGSWTIYDGGHYGEVIWAQAGAPKNHRYYDLDAKKTDLNIYTKWLHQLNNNWSLFADLQYKHVVYNMYGFQDNPSLIVKRNFNFVNPKAGISYRKNNWNAYLSYAMANKEPNRDDFEAAQQQQPRKETLHDFELGIEEKTSKYSWSATGYYMLYNNQLVQTGARNDVGAYTRINVPNSYRLGIELQGSVNLNRWVAIQGNAAFSRNKIKSFTNYLTIYNDDFEHVGEEGTAYSNTDISFSPSIVAGGSIILTPVKQLEIGLPAKYVSKQYMDNTQKAERSLRDYYVQDARVIYTIKNFLFNEWNITGYVNNVFNRKYEATGAAYPGIAAGYGPYEDNYYTTMAGTNFMVAVNIRL